MVQVFTPCTMEGEVPQKQRSVFLFFSHFFPHNFPVTSAFQTFPSRSFLKRRV